MGRKSQEYKFLFISSVVVVLLGLKTVSSLIDEPLAPKISRAPSSISKQASSLPAPALSPSSMPMNLDFNCKKEDKKEFVVKGAFLQIRGKGCAKTAGHEISIINKSNGYTASVFHRGSEEFQTDLIQLVEGQNEIFIQYSNAQGKKLQRQVLVNSSHI
jgi:hypothetical protein